MLLKNEFSLEEFVNIIIAMEDNKLIAQYYQPATNNLAYNQLPYEVSKAFIKLENVMSKSPLTQFMSALAKHAEKGVDKKVATVESQQALFLLSFLLSHDVAISIDDEIFSFKHFTNTVNLKVVTADPKKWLQEHHSELIKSLDHFWKAQILEITLKRREREELAKHRKEYEDAIKQDQAEELVKYLALRNEHSFDFLQLDMSQLSYAIDGFILQGKIQVFSGQSCAFRPELSQETSLLLHKFNELAKYKGLLVVTQEEIFEAFVLMMNSLIIFSMTPNDSQLASQRLLGFMIFHNFEIQHQNQVFRISDMLKFCDFNIQVTEEWLNQQGYPSKLELENLISIEQAQKSFLPLYAQQSEHLMQVEIGRNDSVEMEIENKQTFQWLFK